MKYFFFATFIFLLSSCSDDYGPGTYRDGEINPQVRAMIASQHDQIIKAMQQNKPHVIEGYLSASLSEQHDAVHAFVERASERLLNGNATVLHAYHQVNRGSDESVAILSKDSLDPNGFQIRFQAQTPESFVVISDPGLENDAYRIFMVFGKYEEHWKLDILNMGRVTVAQKNAVDYFEQAKEEEQKGNLTNAINAMVIATSISSPAAPYWSYRIQPEMEAYNTSLMNQALERYPMPISLTSISTAPEIFKIMPQRVEDKICTMVKYRSTINIEDSVALEAENQAIHALMPGTFQGIDDDVPYIFYRAYNEAPREGVTVPYFGFVKEVSETKVLP